MEHTAAELAQKLKEMHPQIADHDLSLDLKYNSEKEYWIVKLERGDIKLHTFLDKKDADACLEGVQCVYLGLQIDQFVDNFKHMGSKAQKS